MKKVLQITNQMYPYIGGIEQVARDIGNVLNERNDIEQKIICFNGDAKDGNYICHKDETVCDIVDDIEVIRCSISAKVFSQQISFSFPFQLKKIMNEFDPDIVIFHYPNPFQAHFILRHKNKKFKLFIYWHLDITKQKILGKLFNKQNISLIKRADKIIGATPSHVNESKYTEYFGEKKSNTSVHDK